MTASRDGASERYLASFPAGRVLDFPVLGLDPALEVPLHAASLPDGPDHPGGSGLGYGPTPEQARVGALGEMAEMALSARHLVPQPRREGSYDALVAELGADRVADPLTLCLPAGVAYDGTRPLQWLPVRRLRDGETVLAPAELVASGPADLPGPPPPDGWLTTVITNGQGAAFSAEAATAHALLEVLQRDGNAVSFRAMDRGTVVDLGGLRDPGSRALLARMDAAGIDVTVKLASTELGVVDVYAVGHSRALDEPVPIMATACGEAAHPDAEVAVAKALHELASARARKAFMHGPLDLVARATPPGYLEHWLSGHPPERLVEEDRALREMRAWLCLRTEELVGLLASTVFSRTTTVALADLQSSSPPDVLAAVVAQLAAEDLDVLVDVQPAATGDAVAAKVLVPGAEVETMSYGRLGERGVRRLRERGDPLVAVGARPDGSGWASVHLDDAARERLGGPAWFDRLGADQRVGRLYPLYREPGRHIAARPGSATRPPGT